MAKVITVAQYGSAKEREGARAAAMSRLWAEGAMLTTRFSDAMTRADQINGVVVTVVGEKGRDGKQVYAATSGAGWEAGASAGGSSGSGGTAATGNVAANASVKGFSGGGVQDIGSTNIQGVGIAVLGEFLGVDYQTADTKLPEGKSPDAQNVDGMGRGGALSLRPGLIAFHPKRNDAAPSAVPAGYRGRSINLLSPALGQSTYISVLVGYDQSSNIGTSLASTSAAYIKKFKPLWHPQKDIEHVAPKIKLTDSTAAGGITFNVSMPLGFRKNAPVVASVDQLIVRRSSLTYPQDRDGKDDTSSSIVQTKDYASYDGTSTTITDSHSSVVAGATKYYSTWCVSKLQATPKASLRVVIA